MIERNHPRDIDQQKTEVVKYWLRNSPDASWTTLANAVEEWEDMLDWLGDWEICFMQLVVPWLGEPPSRSIDTLGMCINLRYWSTEDRGGQILVTRCIMDYTSQCSLENGRTSMHATLYIALACTMLCTHGSTVSMSIMFVTIVPYLTVIKGWYCIHCKTPPSMN